MITVARWMYLLASIAFVSAYAVDNNRLAPFRDVTSVCGTTNGRVSIASRLARPRNAYSTLQSRQTENSSVVLPIDVYMQVLSTDGTEQGGDISDATIEAQLRILNDAFRPVGFSFNLVETVRTINEQWYYGLKIASPYENEVSLALRKGGNATLNIYTMGGLSSNHAWATLPRELQGRAAYDGIFQNGTVFLGGSNPMFNKGITLVHEVGHWFGLYHTFGNGCEQSYDYVADTPVENQPLVLGGCEVGRNSCPDQPGLDLVHNYMGYSDDDCRNSFTPGQIQRMREQMAKFRGVVYPGIEVDKIPEDTL